MIAPLCVLLALTQTPPWFSDVGATAHVTFVDRHGRAGADKHSITEVNGGGVGLFDLEGDGDLDLFFAQGDPHDGTGPQPSAVYVNEGGMRFVDATAAVGLELAIDACGVAVGDVDDDGDDDLYVTAIGDDVLLRNDAGKLVRTDGACGASDPLWSTSACLCDLDGDGDLDLYVCNYLALDEVAQRLTREGSTFRGKTVMAGPLGFTPVADRLYRNRLREDGVLRFEPLPDDPSSTPRFALGVLAFDADGDHDQDLYVANDSHANALLRNDGDMKFVDVGVEAGVALGAQGNAQAGMGVSVGDLDGDRADDLFVTNFSHDTNTLYRALGHGLFKDASRTSGLGPPSFAQLGFGCVFVDPDQDGDLDVIVANGHVYPNVDALDLGTTYRQRLSVFDNDGRGRFRVIDDAIDVAPCVARGLARGDLDGDGREDLIVTRLNDAPLVLRATATRNHRVVVHLVGGPRSGTSAFGARATLLREGEPTLVRTVSAGGSFQSASSRDLVFGLGAAAEDVVFEVEWPSGVKQRVSVKVDTRVCVTEGDDEARVGALRESEK